MSVWMAAYHSAIVKLEQQELDGNKLKSTTMDSLDAVDAGSAVQQSTTKESLEPGANVLDEGWVEPKRRHRRRRGPGRGLSRASEPATQAVGRPP